MAKLDLLHIYDSGVNALIRWDFAGNEDAIAVVSFAVIALLASLLLAMAFSWPADIAEALLTLS
jgi:hypothetical protein